ncbi:MAG: hypothetical protein IPM81_03860 [Saprospirales bacterium]|nr:hypothetical protein [Saprospirales bacterium]
MRAFRARKLDEAELLFQALLLDMERRPCIKRLVWRNFGVFTFDLEAMTWNNLGAIKIEIRLIQGQDLAKAKAWRMMQGNRGAWSWVTFNAASPLLPASFGLLRAPLRHKNRPEVRQWR